MQNGRSSVPGAFSFLANAIPTRAEGARTGVQVPQAGTTAASVNGNSPPRRGPQGFGNLSIEVPRAQPASWHPGHSPHGFPQLGQPVMSPQVPPGALPSPYGFYAPMPPYAMHGRPFYAAPYAQPETPTTPTTPMMPVRPFATLGCPSLATNSSPCRCRIGIPRGVHADWRRCRPCRRPYPHCPCRALRSTPRRPPHLSTSPPKTSHRDEFTFVDVYLFADNEGHKGRRTCIASAVRIENNKRTCRPCHASH